MCTALLISLNKISVLKDDYAQCNAIRGTN